MSRPFLAIPLFELDPEFIIPGTRIPIKQVASQLATGKMKALPKYTALVRKEASHGYR
jgi:7,8-dihydro-6-hydroxymethylpterin-pyrophosphokinase